MLNEKEKKAKLKDLKSLLKYFNPYKYQLTFLFLLVFLINILSIFYGYYNGLAVTNITNFNFKEALVCLILVLLIQILIEPGYRIIYYFINKIQIKISKKVSYDVYKKTMNLPAYAFEDMSSGEILNRVTGDTDTVTGNLEELIDILSFLITTIIVFFYILSKSIIIAGEIFLFIILYIIIVKKFTKKMKDYNRKTKKVDDKYTALTNESVRGIREIRTMGITNSLIGVTASLINDLVTYIIKEEKNKARFNIITAFLSVIFEFVVFITCLILIIYKQIDLTFFIAMTYYFYKFVYLINAVRDFSRTYGKMLVSLERINEILENKLYEDVVYGNKELDNIEGYIEFKNVNFNYKNEKTLLNNFNIKFEPNKKIAIVGASGGGKSTIFNLLTRIFDPIAGNIYIDNMNIKELTEESLRKNISIIRQEPFIFNRTILENFKLLDENISLDEIRKYTKMASIDDYIMNLPKQYNTILGEGGVNLSGGQKQRLSIARSLMKKSKIILFDEATSALDNESQNIIKKSIDKLAKNHTVLIIAHRLSTIIDADLIYVIKDGKVFASGNHEELMKKNEYYRNLYKVESID